MQYFLSTLRSSIIKFSIKCYYFLFYQCLTLASRMTLVKEYLTDRIFNNGQKYCTFVWHCMLQSNLTKKTFLPHILGHFFWETTGVHVLAHTFRPTLYWCFIKLHGVNKSELTVAACGSVTCPFSVSRHTIPQFSAVRCFPNCRHISPASESWCLLCRTFWKVKSKQSTMLWV